MQCKSYSHFFSKKFQHICVSLDVNFNESLTNDVVSFEQLGPGIFQPYNWTYQYIQLMHSYQISLVIINGCYKSVSSYKLLIVKNLYVTCNQLKISIILLVKLTCSKIMNRKKRDLNLSAFKVK